MLNQRRLETIVAAVATLALSAVFLQDGAPAWWLVLAFSLFVISAENTGVIVHSGTSVSPSFMAVMAAIAVLHSNGDGGVLAGAGAIGACGGLFFEHVRARRFGMLALNIGQYSLSAMAAASAFSSLAPVHPLVAALVAAAFFGVVNVVLVLPHVAFNQGESVLNVWAGMRPAVPNYLAFGLLGLLIGLLCAELGLLAVVLLAVPMAIGRWTFATFLQVRDAQQATIGLFIRLIEAKDPYTAGHTERVGKYAMFIGEELGLSAERLEHLHQSALMHDVGKLAVPSRLLNKPGRLTSAEFDVVRNHNEAGIGILARVDFMREMAVTASDRHGHFSHGADGAPPELVLEAHIVAVADAFDAMTSTRAYRRALDQDVTFDELRKNAGTQFDPACVEALIDTLGRRGERYGLGHEVDAHQFAVPPPVAGVGSAGLGDLSEPRPEVEEATS